MYYHTGTAKGQLMREAYFRVFAVSVCLVLALLLGGLANERTKTPSFQKKEPILPTKGH